MSSWKEKRDREHEELVKRALDDYYSLSWIECDRCGGDGYLDDKCQCETVASQCFCEVPTPRKCQMCNGDGGWFPQPPEE